MKLAVLFEKELTLEVDEESGIVERYATLEQEGEHLRLTIAFTDGPTVIKVPAWLTHARLVHDAIVHKKWMLVQITPGDEAAKSGAAFNAWKDGNEGPEDKLSVGKAYLNM